jgi:hypothetical protein
VIVILETVLDTTVRIKCIMNAIQTKVMIWAMKVDGCKILINNY